MITISLYSKSKTCHRRLLLQPVEKRADTRLYITCTRPFITAGCWMCPNCNGWQLNKQNTFTFKSQKTLCNIVLLQKKISPTLYITCHTRDRLVACTLLEKFIFFFLFVYFLPGWQTMLNGFSFSNSTTRKNKK